jgi:hypothetical protein
MEENEEKGFVVKDRRKFSLEEDAPQPATEPSQEPMEAEAEASQPNSSGGTQGGGDRGGVPLPEVTIATFIFSLSSSALVHLGDIPDPDTKDSRVDLPLAKQIIDTLGMLQEKTKGNLAPDEDNLLKSILYDLRLRYVQKSSK